MSYHYNLILVDYLKHSDVKPENSLTTRLERTVSISIITREHKCQDVDPTREIIFDLASSLKKCPFRVRRFNNNMNWTFNAWGGVENRGAEIQTTFIGSKNSRKKISISANWLNKNCGSQRRILKEMGTRPHPTTLTIETCACWASVRPENRPG